MKFLGLDGGGSKTTAVLCDLPEQTVKSAIRGPGSASIIGVNGIKELVLDILKELSPGDSISEIQGATLSFAGVGREGDKKKVFESISEIGLNRINIISDAEMLHYAAFGKNDGILIESGTGAVCLYGKKDNLKQLGGWGYLLGDEGGGYDMGREAVKSALNDENQARNRSTLTDALLKFYELSKPEDFISVVYNSDNPQNLLASSAELICSYAEDGNEKALRIVEKASGALVNLALSAIEMHKSEPPFRLACAGALLENKTPVLKGFKSKLQDSEVEIDWIGIPMSPAAAGAAFAIESAGEELPDSLFDKLCEMND